MFRKLILLLTISIVFSALAVFGQKKERTEEEPAPQRETRVEKDPVETPKRVEAPREQPRQVETPRSEPPRRPDNPPPSNSGNEPKRGPNPKERPSDPENPRPQRPNDDNVDGPKRPKKPELPPVENPNPSGNPNPSPIDNNNNNQGRNKDKDKDDKDRDDKWRNRNRNGGWGTYPTTIIIPTTSTPSRPFSLRDYFDKDDVFFDTYNTYIDAQVNVLPLFDDSPISAFQPLYYSYGRKFFRNEFPFVADDWTIYYEPDLDDIFVDFAKLGNVKYERMVMYAIGETVKKVAKKFKYKGSEMRPVLVEKIPDIEQDRIYSFNVTDLPKGDYELRLIARDGATVKHSIRLK